MRSSKDLILMVSEVSNKVLAVEEVVVSIAVLAEEVPTTLDAMGIAATKAFRATRMSIGFTTSTM